MLLLSTFKIEVNEGKMVLLVIKKQKLYLIDLKLL